MIFNHDQLQTAAKPMFGSTFGADKNDFNMFGCSRTDHELVGLSLNVIFTLKLYISLLPKIHPSINHFTFNFLSKIN